MNLLRSFDSSSRNAVIVQTRVVSRVLLRVGEYTDILYTISPHSSSVYLSE